MTNPVFPTLSTGQDSSKYTRALEDVAMKTTMDGGYVVSRAKHTRAPRRTFTSGFTSIRKADKELLEAFYDTVKGGSVIFDWIDPTTQMGVSPTPVTYAVRFTGEFKWQYRGIGPTELWDVTFTLEQA
jgi:hypothetical protein